MYEKELFDETLDINSTNNYEISIQLGLNGFSFCLLDNLRKRFVMFREYKLPGREELIARRMEEIADSDEFLSRQYRKYRLVFNLEQSTIVPATLYDPAIKDEYFMLNHSLGEHDTVSNNKLVNPDAYLLFSVRKDIFDMACRLFPEASLSHQTRPLLHSSFRDARKIRDRYIRVHIDCGFFTLIIIKDDALQFINTFRVRNDSDILYYLMNSFNRFNIPAEEPVYLSGDILKYDELYNNMLRYSTTLKFAKPQGDFSLSYIFDDMAVHRYCNLFNIVSCA